MSITELKPRMPRVRKPAITERLFMNSGVGAGKGALSAKSTPPAEPVKKNGPIAGNKFPLKAKSKKPRLSSKPTGFGK